MVLRLLRKLQNNVPRAPLLTTYKSFIRSNLDYGDLLYDQVFNNSFHERLELIQKNSAHAITRLRIATATMMVQETLFLYFLK